MLGVHCPAAHMPEGLQGSPPPMYVHVLLGVGSEVGVTGADEAGGGVEVVGGAGDSYTGLDAGSSVPGVLAERCGHVLLPGYAILVARALSRSSACSSDLESVVAWHRHLQ